MSGELRNLKSNWVDSDDAPELTDESLDDAEWKIGDVSVSSAAGIAELGKATLRCRTPLGASQNDVSPSVMTLR